jgi:integrase/recombinase XerD
VPITDDTVKDITVGLQELPQRLSPISVNSYLRVLRTYLRWRKVRGADGLLIQVKPINQPKVIPRTYTEEELSAMFSAPVHSMSGERAQLVAVLYYDTGARAKEILQLRRSDIDLNNCLIKIDGKGSKERIVPFSVELRGDLRRWMEREPEATLLFPRYSQRNALRDFKHLAASVGITGKRTSFHTFRHTKGTNYMAEGGNVYKLKDVLGHSSISTTELYVHMNTKPLTDEHKRLSLLGRIKRKRRAY